MSRPTTVDAYLADLAPDRRAGVELLRQTAIAAAPDAVETIAYSMPALRTRDGQFLVSYAAYKKHYSLFPANAAVVDALGAEVAPYFSGRGTVQFPTDKPIPVDLVTRIVAIRVAEVAAREGR
jgi:uncharacterized protein YdhG (YjbR/CyaY superfamily)